MFNIFRKKKEENKLGNEVKEIHEQPQNPEPKEIEQPNYKKPLTEIESKTDKKIIEIIKKIKDPELDIDIWSLELIYDININENNIDIKMTFTSPMCPFGPEIVRQVKEGLESLGHNEPKIELVFSPPWSPSEEVKELLGMHG